jgi:hypothetical protein
MLGKRKHTAGDNGMRKCYQPPPPPPPPPPPDEPPPPPPDDDPGGDDDELIAEFSPLEKRDMFEPIFALFQLPLYQAG